MKKVLGVFIGVLLLSTPCYGFSFGDGVDLLNKVQDTAEALSDSGSAQSVPSKNDAKAVAKEVSKQKNVSADSSEKKKSAPTKSVARQKEPTSKEKDLMTSVCRIFQDMPDLAAFNRDLGESREPENYKASKRYFERDYNKLVKLNPNIDSSNYKVWGKSFSERLAAGRKLITSNEATLNAYYNGKPNDEALQKIDDAVQFGRVGAKLIRDGADFDAMASYYSYYSKDKAAAVALDKAVLTYRKSEIEYCETHFVKPFRALYEEKRQEDERIAQQEEAKRQARARRRAEAEKADALKREKRDAERTKLAKENGFSTGFIVGIKSLLYRIERGAYDLDAAKECLIFPNRGDNYKVLSLMSGYVQYTSDFGSDFEQILLVREDGQFYSEGASLKDSYFQFIGIREGTTVLGARKQVGVFKVVHVE